MTDVVACIPTIGMSPYLQPLVETLLKADVTVHLMVNSKEIPESVSDIADHFENDYPIVLRHYPEFTIYQEWNKFIAYLKHNAYGFFVCDDVTITPFTANELALALDARPGYGLISADHGEPRHQPIDVTRISHEQGNRYEFATWCFMARTDAWVNVDDRYKIWYGDDDLIEKVNKAGWATGVLRGEAVHHHTSTTSRQLPWVMQAAHEDGVLWASLH